MKTWQLFVRHGHRALGPSSADTGLSSRGEQEIREIVDNLRTGWADRKITRILFSPRLRCQMSADILAGALGISSEICDELLEQQSSESNSEFSSRISNWKRDHENICGLCAVTHADVLPVICDLFKGPELALRTGGAFWVVDKVVADIHT